MKARVMTTGEIVDIIRNSAFDKDVFYDSNGQKYNREELSFDFKEKSFPKDEDYWTRFEHQAAIAVMGGMYGNTKYNDYAWVDMAKFAIEAAHALVEKYKKEEK